MIAESCARDPDTLKEREKMREERRELREERREKRKRREREEKERRKKRERCDELMSGAAAKASEGKQKQPAVKQPQINKKQ